MQTLESGFEYHPEKKANRTGIAVALGTFIRKKSPMSSQPAPQPGPHALFAETGRGWEGLSPLLAATLGLDSRGILSRMSSAGK